MIMATKKTTKRKRPAIKTPTDADSANPHPGTAQSATFKRLSKQPPPVTDDFEDYDQLKTALRFSKEEIDEALVRQPVLYEQVSSHLAYSINHRDLVREQQKRTEAFVANEIREQSEVKLTVKEVEAAVEQDQRYIDARESYKRASLWVDKWDGLKDSYRQRSAALRDLTQLHVTGHYQVGARSYEDAREAMAQKRRSV